MRGTLIPFWLVVVGGGLFAAGVATGSPWLTGPGLVLVPVGVVLGLRG